MKRFLSVHEVESAFQIGTTLTDTKSMKNYFLLSESCKNLKIITESKTINPTAVPMIQRYMKIFEAYEQQNGIENPFVKE